MSHNISGILNILLNSGSGQGQKKWPSLHSHGYLPWQITPSEVGLKPEKVFQPLHWVFSRGKREKEFKKGKIVALMCRPSSCYHPLYLSHIIIDSIKYTA